LTFDLHDGTSTEPATSSPAPRVRLIFGAVLLVLLLGSLGAEAAALQLRTAP
jgi:hypothetical protein